MSKQTLTSETMSLLKGEDYYFTTDIEVSLDQCEMPGRNLFEAPASFDDPFLRIFVAP